MINAYLETAIVEPEVPATASVIWLHGLGADGHDFEAAVPLLNLPQTAPIRFIFPHAPVRPVTINNGWPMRSWYDILAIDIERRIDEQALMDSVAQISLLIEREIGRGIAPERIILAGFSQGGAVAYQTALCYPQRLGGLVVLSTYMATTHKIRQEKSPANANLPVWLAHGVLDDVVPFSLGEQAVVELQHQGYEPEWHRYPIAHEVSAEELTELGHWIEQILDVKEL
ncbi:MAG: alpha/beta hydrolase [Pontibacterium sp.]